MNKLAQFIASHLPAKVTYFAYIRLMAFATTHDEGQRMTPDTMPFSTAVNIWERYHKI